ncbi:dipeptide epimerase [Pseudidiomarina sp. 1APR75-33.1]|uniref:mandelate racemase/muconate lactonizing enzyme family protein n=1 Tax=Pseudidiomarina terrestris TaxID=2820060 RepID=UPI00264EAA11|nr:dipeptide epimerase [Pseudidiomarina sp. 1APR75-33.1]MDN7125957.1 dipeptide epimerase [Pseudidiomarina sp. 1APR75-33.1]
MKISAIKLAHLNVEMHHAIKTPIGEIAAARNVVVKIETDTGLYGWGETSPMAAITGDSQASAYALGRDMASLLVGCDALALEPNMEFLRRYCARATSILCAFDMALYDLAAKHAGMPLYQFLGGAPRQLETDHTIGHQETVAATVAMAKRLVAAGFNTIKLKTGRPGLEDLEHLQAVREEVGPKIKLRIDCNQGWDLPTAVGNLKHLEALDIEYLEQPLPVWDVDGFAQLRLKTTIPICADESVFTHIDALRLVKADAVDYLNIKLVKSGGINTALKINSIAEAAGIRCMVGCFGESRLGLSAAAHLAAARRNICFIDLDSALHFCEDPVHGGMDYVPDTGGSICLPATPGHGAEFDEKALSKVIEICS